MARLKKFPKQPKASSSLATWERYKARCQEVARYNAAVKAAPKKKESIKSAVAKLKNRF